MINKNEVIEKIGELAHKLLIEHRKISDPKPYIKITKDQNWILQNGTDQVNLSDCDYFNLPEDWKLERIRGSEIVFDEIQKQVSEKKDINKDFIEEIANLLHDKWLERNNQRATEEQKNRYIDMSEYEKEKDRIFVYAGLEILNHNNPCKSINPGSGN